MNAYLDIETSYRNEITVFGVYTEHSGLSQLISADITPQNILKTLEGVSSIYTYNGNRFDLPVIAKNTGLKLSDKFKTCDLMYDCWSKNLYGGLKLVEKALGIKRILEGMDGHDALDLWERYIWFKDKDALKKLLKYNEEDVVNLKTLRQRLSEY